VTATAKLRTLIAIALNTMNFMIGGTANTIAEILGV
jgi:hypothetical protein